MAYILARARVPNYTQWWPTFQENAARRQAAGLKSEQLFRNPDDPTDVIALFAVDDAEQARQYLFSEGSRQRQRAHGGVVEVVYLPEA